MGYPAVSLQTFIDKRDFDKANMTNRFFDIVREPLTEAAKRITGLDREYQWTSVERTIGTSQYVTVHAYISLAFGDNIRVNGEEVLITEANIERYNNSFNATIALPILQTLDAQRIHDHIKFTLNVIRTQPAELIVEMLNKVIESDVHLVVAPEHQELLEKMTRPRYISGFDTINLTEEQTNALQLTINSAEPKSTN